MKEFSQNGNPAVPMLFPFEPEHFWREIRQIIREEINKAEKERPAASIFETSGLAYKPLLKITEVCDIFQISKPTVYAWIKYGRLKPHRVCTRLYFLWNDIQELLAPKDVKDILKIKRGRR